MLASCNPLPVTSHLHMLGGPLKIMPTWSIQRNLLFLWKITCSITSSGVAHFHSENSGSASPVAKLTSLSPFVNLMRNLSVFSNITVRYNEPIKLENSSVENPLSPQAHKWFYTSVDVYQTSTGKEENCTSQKTTEDREEMRKLGYWRATSKPNSLNPTNETCTLT